MTEPALIPSFLHTDFGGIKKTDKAKVKKSIDHTYLTGDIDKYYEQTYPEDHRWDYVIHNTSKHRIAFFEIHEASTSGFSEVKKKYLWLKDMIRVKASELNYYKNKPDLEFYWIWTDKNKFKNPNTPQYKEWKTSKEIKHIKLQDSLNI